MHTGRNSKLGTRGMILAERGALSNAEVRGPVELLVYQDVQNRVEFSGEGVDD